MLGLLAGLRDARAEGLWVGIELAPGQHGGVGVRGVIPGAPAALTDLRAGDEVLAIDGVAVHTSEALRQAIAARPIGRRLELTVRGSDGKSRAVVLAPAARPSDLELTKQRLVGRPAPPFQLSRVAAPAGEASEDSLAKHRGHPLLIDFWATWCGPCVRALPELSALRDRYRARGLDVIGVSSESSAEIAAAMKRYGVRHPILADRNDGTFRAYAIGAMPTLVLVDGQGVVRAVHVGAGLDAVEASVRELLEAGP